MPKNMEEAVRELQNTATVMAGIQARQAEALKAHAEWLQEHDREIAEMRALGKATDERIADMQALGKATDERIEKLVTAIG